MKRKYIIVIGIVVMGLLVLAGCSTTGNDKETYKHFKELYTSDYEKEKKEYSEGDFSDKLEDYYFDVNKIDKLPVTICKNEQRNEYVVKVIENETEYNYGVVVDDERIEYISSTDYNKAIKLDGVTKVYERN